MSKKWRSLLVCTLLVGTVLSGCGGKEKAAASLSVGITGSSIKAAMVVLAQEMGYYKEEGLDVTFENIVDLNAGLTAIETGKLDILPTGVIPTIAFNAQGSDFVIFGGTIAEGSQMIVTKEKLSTITDLSDFAGKKVACVRAETGHMIAKGLMRETGIDTEQDVEFVEMDGFQSVIEAVRKGMTDVGFVNSGYGQVAEEQGLAVVMNVGELAPDFVCCRQTTSHQVMKEKRDALVKFQIANLRAYKLCMEDKETAVSKLAAFSGQSEAYVEYCLYAQVMKITMDPAKNRVNDLYEIMVANGDIAKDNSWDTENAVDSTIYKEALDEIKSRYPDAKMWQELEDSFEKNNR